MADTILKSIIQELAENEKLVSQAEMEKFADAILKADRIFVAEEPGRLPDICGKSFCQPSDAYGTYSILCRRNLLHGNQRRRPSGDWFRKR